MRLRIICGLETVSRSY